MANSKVARACAEFIRLILYLTRPISDYVLSFIYELFMGATKLLPPIENQLLLLSAKQLAEKIRKRQVKCEDVMKAYVERSKAVNPFINAVVDARYEQALEEARAVDIFLDSQKKSIDDIEKDTPLLGVPFSCKEAIGVEGLTQTCGLVMAKGRVAEKDADSTALYRKAGAIPVTVTNVPQLCMWWETDNLLFGMTKNPFNHTRTVGGSTGGEGAILTSAGAVIGIGNDIAGSIRIPASFCGIYGHKPSTGLVSNHGFFPSDDQENEKLDAFVSTGPMCRYVEDLPILMKILAKDEKRLRLNEKVNFRRVKVYYMEQFPGLLISSVPAIKKVVRKAASYFGDEYGIEPIPLTIDELAYAMLLWECKLLETGMPSFAAFLAGGKGEINMWFELVKCIMRKSNHTLPAIYFGIIEKREKDDFYHECLKKYNDLERKFKDIFSEDAILILPTHPEPPPHYMLTIPKYENSGYTSIFSILGFPSTTIPAGMCLGMPIGIQAVSGRDQDHLTIAAALELDKVFGGWRSPCEIKVCEK